MDILKKSAENYRNYIDYDYTFTLDCGISITAMFKAENYYHLSGLHYLKDIVQLDKRLYNNSAKNIYKKILNGKITHSLIEKSQFYNKIQKRLYYFCNFDEIVFSKVIVDFDYTILPQTELLSTYLLYKEYDDGYAILGLKYDNNNDIYIPETFIFSETDYYIKNQTTYNVSSITKKHYKDSNI